MGVLHIILKVGHPKINKTKTICVGHHYAQTNTNSVNKTCALLQITGGKDERKKKKYYNVKLPI
jgi:saccharopine dehydrogenase-like NADP-dependent oxidoreductase